MELTAQSDADRRNLTSLRLKNGNLVNANLDQNCILSTHVISVSYLHSFIECAKCTKDVKTEFTTTVTGNHDEVFGLQYIVTWSWL